MTVGKDYKNMPSPQVKAERSRFRIAAAAVVATGALIGVGKLLQTPEPSSADKANMVETIRHAAKHSQDNGVQCITPSGDTAYATFGELKSGKDKALIEEVKDGTYVGCDNFKTPSRTTPIKAQNLLTKNI